MVIVVRFRTLTLRLNVSFNPSLRLKDENDFNFHKFLPNSTESYPLSFYFSSSSKAEIDEPQIRRKKKKMAE